MSAAKRAAACGALLTLICASWLRTGLVTLQPLPCLGKASCGQGSDRPLSLLRHTKLLDALAGRACGPTRTPPGAARDNPAAKTLDQCLCRLAPPARAPAAIKGL